jgi:hypothetical protein
MVCVALPADRYTNSGQFDKALHVYLRLGRGDVFALIEKHSLFHAIQDKIVLLMQFDAKKAVELLVHNAHRISVPECVKQLEQHPTLQYEVTLGVFLVVC